MLHVRYLSIDFIYADIFIPVSVFLRQGYQSGCQPYSGLPSLLQQAVERCEVCHEDTGRQLCTI